MGTRLQMFRISRRVARKSYDTIKSWKIVKGDTVEILTGKDAGRRGTVERVIRKKNKVIVDGLNLVKKHMRKTEVMDGGVFTKAAAVPVSNVALIDPIDGKPTRTGWSRDERSACPRLQAHWRSHPQTRAPQKAPRRHRSC